MKTRLILGTAQFGTSYGIANSYSEISLASIINIIDLAKKNDVNTLDTASNYGNCEKHLGKIGLTDWNIISKLPSLQHLSITEVESWILNLVTNSLSNLNAKKLYGLLLHHPLDLNSSQGSKIYQQLNKLKELNLVDKIGISIYNIEELDALCSKYSFDIIQAPCNILDRRIIDSGWSSYLQSIDTEIHVRSVFLQGLLLMDKNKRPEKFKKWQSLWDYWHEWLSDSHLNSLETCLSYIMHQESINKVIVGVDDASQLQEIINVLSNPLVPYPNDFISHDTNLLNPSQW